MIRFACPSCGESVQAPAERAGARARCPKCRDPVDVPTGAVPPPFAPAIDAPRPTVGDALASRLSGLWRRVRVHLLAAVLAWLAFECQAQGYRADRQAKTIMQQIAAAEVSTQGAVWGLAAVVAVLSPSAARERRRWR